MTNTVTVNGNTYTDDSHASTGLGNGGHRTRLVLMLSDAVADLAAKQAAAAASAATASTQASNASSSASAAAASAAIAAAIAGGFVGTSATSWTPSIGSQAFATQAGEQYTAGVWVTVVSAANGANNGYGQVISYTGTTLTVDVQVASGSGAHTDWNISIAGVRGPAGSNAGTDLVARDQIALTNIRLMLNTAITTGALAEGKQWELSTDEWAATSTDEIYVAATIDYYSNVAPETLYTATGSTFGNMTGNGGLAALFDTNTSQDHVQGAYFLGTAGYAGKAFSEAQNITQVKVYGTNNEGFVQSGNPSVTITIYGKASSPANATDGTSMGTVTFTDTATTNMQAIVTSGTYQYVWAAISTASSSYIMAAEIEYFIGGGAVLADITLIPPAAVTVSASPTYVDCYFLYKDDSGTAVLGTDLAVDLSGDGGTDWAVATLSTVASYDGTYSIVKARADISGATTTGTSLSARIKTFNLKSQRIAAPAIYAE